MSHVIVLTIVGVVVAIVALLLTGTASKRELAAHLAQQARVVDVRKRDEFESGHYPGAVNLPLHLLHARLGELGDKQQPVILYCNNGMRSGSARVVLLRAGFKHVHNAGNQRYLARAAALLAKHE
jgi:phage shock protein E